MAATATLGLRVLGLPSGPLSLLELSFSDSTEGFHMPLAPPIPGRRHNVFLLLYKGSGIQLKKRGSWKDRQHEIRPISRARNCLRIHWTQHPIRPGLPAYLPLSSPPLRDIVPGVLILSVSFTFIGSLLVSLLGRRLSCPGCLLMHLVVY